jgi:hypothetical protein
MPKKEFEDTQYHQAEPEIDNQAQIEPCRVVASRWGKKS